MRKPLVALLLLTSSTGLVFLAPQAQAALVEYTTQTAFLNATATGYYLESFKDLPDNPGNSRVFSQLNGFGYTASATGGLYGVSPSADRALSVAVFTDPIVIAFTGPSVTAIGGLFFPTDLGGIGRVGQITLTFSDSSTWNSSSASRSSFVGFTSSEAITSFSIAATQGTCGTGFDCYATVDNLYVGAVRPADAPVPVPATALLLGLGLMGLVRARRRFALSA